ncbi:MAG TPA: protein kinase [Vicinamibacteria bacterium]|nr:protein kinase [Vicinamibacteria bacterium]
MESGGSSQRPSRLGHFEITEVLGVGGMGVVFRAQDLRLGRQVALKVLSRRLFTNEGARSLFFREARLAASLTHPNIAAIYEIDEESGTPFIAMELVPGVTLKESLLEGPLPVDRVLSIGCQVCDGLAAAHELGVVHRDVKSANIMLTPEGRAKILDFGLAKASMASRGAKASEESSPPIDLTPVKPLMPSPGPSVSQREWTDTGLLFGTPSYMSPEQARGEAVDPRSDLFSLGVALYEASTGELPFQGRNDREVIEAVQLKEPIPLCESRAHLPPDFSRAVERCLAKDPGKRYASAAQLRDELARLQTRRSLRPWLPWGRLGERFRLAAVAVVVIAIAGLYLTGTRLGDLAGRADDLRNVPIASVERIAVLPFESISSDEDESYLANAVPIELTARLGQLGALRVVPWSFMNGLARGSSMKLGDIAKATGADAVVEGAVQFSPPSKGSDRRLQVHAQMFDARTGTVLWSRSFERGLGDFFELQSELARHIASQIRIGLARREERLLAMSRQVAPEAMELYLRGREASGLRTEESLIEAARFFRSAIDADPGFAEAYVGLAQADVLLCAYFGSVPSDEAYRRALEATARAIDLDPDLAEAWTSRAFARYAFALEWDEAEADFRRALELAPSSAEAHHWYADYLTAVGRHQEAIDHARQAEERSPLTPIMSRDVAWAYFYARRYDDAIRQLGRTLSQDPDFTPARTLLGRAYVAVGRSEEGIEELRAAGEAYLAMLAQAQALSGRRAEAEQLLSEILARPTLSPVLPYEVAAVYAALGEPDEAIAWFRRAIEEQDATITNLKTDPTLDSLREDPRYAGLLQELGFPE